MQLDFQSDKLVIIPQDERDALFFDHVLNTGSGKLFIRVGRHEGKWSELPCIEISRFVHSGAYRKDEGYQQNPNSFPGVYSKPVYPPQTRQNLGED